MDSQSPPFSHLIGTTLLGVPTSDIISIVTSAAFRSDYKEVEQKWHKRSTDISTPQVHLLLRCLQIDLWGPFWLSN
jgi:hypothetical protein